MVVGEAVAIDFGRLLAEAGDHPVARANGWPAEPVLDPTGRWLRVQPAGAVVPPQGWKLHVAASVFSAEETLRRVLPVLMAEPAAFKVAASPEKLGILNSGLGGLSQIGKFVTIYPADDEQAVRLAAALDEATRGLTGPAIPSDRPLRPGSVVHYRYGGFGGLAVQSRNGEIAPALRAPNGELVPDLRRPVYQPPDWAVDPFLAAGVAEPLPAALPLVAERYLLLGALHRSARGGV